jgi:hypothetical protein
MKLKLKINESTTDSELIHLGNFFTALGMNRGARVLSAPADEAEYTVTIPPTINIEQELRDGELGRVEGINILTGKPEPKRRRRTKGEIEAAQDSGATFYWSHPESESFGIVIGRAELDKVLASDPLTVEVTKEQYLALVEAKAKVEIAAAEDAAKAEAGKGQADSTSAPSAPTPTATATDTPAASSSEGVANTPATESPSDTKTYTPAEVQKIAVATAGRFGPEKVKAIIAQYPGAARIADLPLTELAGFVAKLNAVS